MCAPGFKNLCKHQEIFGIAVVFVDLDGEFRNGTWTTGVRYSSRAAQEMLAVALLEDQRLGCRLGVRLRRDGLRDLPILSADKKYPQSCHCERKRDR
jgi:hypothetical protein